MTELKNTKQLVEMILEQDKRARNSDSFLYFRILAILGERHGIDIIHVSVADFLLNRVGSEFPNFETVRRTRQKVQAECPWLAASKTVRKHRNKKEATFREFARG